MKKALLSIVIAGCLVMTGIIAQNSLDNNTFDLVVPDYQVDQYPNETAWSSFGNATNMDTATDFDLIVSDPNLETASFDSDTFNSSGRIELERILVDLTDTGSEESKEMFLRYHNENGVVFATQNITLEEGYNSYQVRSPESRDYYGYSYEINVDTGSTQDNSVQIHTVTIDKTVYESLTADVEFPINQLIFWICILFAIVISMAGVTSEVIS